MGPPPAKKRMRMTFANKKSVASRDSILKPECSNQPEDDTVTMCRKIVKCATKKDKHNNALCLGRSLTQRNKQAMTEN